MARLRGFEYHDNRWWALLAFAIVTAIALTARADEPLRVHFTHASPELVDTYDVILGTTPLAEDVGRYTLEAPSSEADGTFRAEVQLDAPLPDVPVHMHMRAKADYFSPPSNVRVIPEAPVVLLNGFSLGTLVWLRRRQMKARSVQFFKGQRRHRLQGIVLWPSRGTLIEAKCGADGAANATQRRVRFVSDKSPITCKECKA